MKVKLKVGMQLPLPLPLLLCLAVTVVAAAAAAIASEPNGYGASFISSPAIYTYSVDNPQQPQQQEEQQQQQQSNYINFSPDNGNYRGGNSNRNYYYTNSNGRNGNFNGNFDSTPSTSGAAAMPTLSTPAAATQPAPQTGCTLDRLAVYKVVLHTYWTRELFPKHYPDWRPTAQWTKTLGRTHNANYALYHIGQPATPGVKQFAETGKSEQLDSNAGEQQQMLAQAQALMQPQMPMQSQFQAQLRPAAAIKTGTAADAAMASSASSASPSPTSMERSVFDEFSLPAIQLGAGRSEAKVFVDSNHSLVSLMTRIVPSPDWFIGVDSFELCVGGSWIDTVTVELDPLDAGTDNGFTFTAPNWPTSPQGVIYRITSRYPAHPAGSFYYPKSKRLPPIATFQFIKLKEYELSEVFNFAEDDRKYETVKTQTHLETEHNHVEMNNELSANIERERQTEYGSRTSSSQQAQQLEAERQRIRAQLLAKMNPSYNNSQQLSTGGNVVPKNDKHALMQSIANSYRRTDVNATSTGLPSSTATSSSSRRRTSTSLRRRRDCRVSHWSEWTACSKSCGIGEMHRYRKVIKHGKRGGRPCPALQESKWCGSERACHGPESYFNWNDSDT